MICLPAILNSGAHPAPASVIESCAAASPAIELIVSKNLVIRICTRSYHLFGRRCTDRSLRVPSKITLDAFYEKVVKVKADLAAIINFSPDRSRRSRLTICTWPRWVPSGDAQGRFQRSALKPLLRGEPR